VLSLLSMLLLLLVVVVARWLSELRHDSAARVAANVTHLACSLIRTWRGKADRTCLVNGWHHEVSTRSLLNLFLVVELTDRGLKSMDGVVLLAVVVSAVEGSRLRDLATVIGGCLGFPLLLVLDANPFLMVTSVLACRCHIVELLNFLTRRQMLTGSTVLEVVRLTLVASAILSALVHGVLSRD
jgi:hypothetical protein